MFIAVIIIIIIAMFTLSGLQVRLPFVTLTTVPAIPGNFQAQLRQLENQFRNVEETVAQINNAVHQREAVVNAPLQGDTHDKQTEILNLLETILRSQQEQKVYGPVENADEEAVDEKPPKRAIMESNKDKMPVQNSERETKVGVEDLGSSEGT